MASAVSASALALAAKNNMSVNELAEALKVSPGMVREAARRAGIVLRREIAPRGGVILTDEQLRDMRTLVAAGHYAHEEALRIVTRPKRKVTWRAPA